MVQYLILLLIALQRALCLPKPIPAQTSQTIEDQWCLGKWITGRCLPRPNPTHNIHEFTVVMRGDGDEVSAHDSTLAATTGLSANNQHRIMVNFVTGYTPSAHTDIHIQIMINDRIYNHPQGDTIDFTHTSFSFTFADSDFLAAQTAAHSTDVTVTVSYWPDQGLAAAESTKSGKKVEDKTSEKKAGSHSSAKEVESS